jgi:hypothetical protein
MAPEKTKKGDAFRKRTAEVGTTAAPGWYQIIAPSSLADAIYGGSNSHSRKSLVLSVTPKLRWEQLQVPITLVLAWQVAERNESRRQSGNTRHRGGNS